MSRTATDRPSFVYSLWKALRHDRRKEMVCERNDQKNPNQRPMAKYLYRSWLPVGRKVT